MSHPHLSQSAPIPDTSGVGALLHAMLPQLASLFFDEACGSTATTIILLELAQAAGWVLPLHTLCIAFVNLGAIAPLVGSLRKLSLGNYLGDVLNHDDLAKGAFESLLAHAHQLQELEVLRPPPPRCAWVSPSLQKLSIKDNFYAYSHVHLRDVLYGNLPALREVQVGRVLLHGLPSSEEGAAAIEVLRACLTASPVSYSIRGIRLAYHEEGHLQPWLRPLADLFADRTQQAACVECVYLEYIAVDAGSVQGLASVLPAIKGGAQASSTAIALTALHAK